MLRRLLSPYQEPVFALVRILLGLMFAYHGAQKLFGLFGGVTPDTGSQLWFGAIIELTCGIGIALGIFTRELAFLASGTMAVAYVQFHWKLELGKRFLPGVNRGEMALLYALVFLYFACHGSGPLSIDRLRGRR